MQKSNFHTHSKAFLPRTSVRKALRQRLHLGRRHRQVFRPKRQPQLDFPKAHATSLSEAAKRSFSGPNRLTQPEGMSFNFHLIAQATLLI
ncbi:MAG: hypothetical protein EBS01_06115 [Verrucomicrobia bacterium]|nr:hypothetical protein [Verrucomicrobiota bacterium]